MAQSTNLQLNPSNVDLRDDIFIDSNQHALTKANLALFNGDEVDTVQSKASTVRSSSSRASAASIYRVRQSLKNHGILMDEATELPIDIDQLVKTVKQPRKKDTAPQHDTLSPNLTPAETSTDDRSRGVTPISEMAANRSKIISNMREANAIWELGTIFAPKFDQKDALIEQQINQLFVMNSIPSKHTSPGPDLRLPTPKPDFTYGYSESAFTREESNLLSLLRTTTEKICLVTDHMPFLPFWVIEWKAKNTNGNIAVAENQASRAGAAIVFGMFNLLQALGQPEPGRAQTAAFSLCVDSYTAHLRVHWRSVDQSGEVLYQSDVIQDAMINRKMDVFEIRTTILNILKWAQGERLKSIKDAMRSYLDKQRRGSDPLNTVTQD